MPSILTGNDESPMLQALNYLQKLWIPKNINLIPYHATSNRCATVANVKHIAEAHGSYHIGHAACSPACPRIATEPFLERGRMPVEIPRFKVTLAVSMQAGLGF